MFLLGVAVGVGATLAVTRRQAPPPQAAIRKPTAAEKATVKALFNEVPLDQEQRRALYESGVAIGKAQRPMTTLPPATVATLRGLHDLIIKFDCTAAGEICKVYRIDLARCFDDAALILEQRRRKRDSIPYDLFQGAIGVYAITHDTNLHAVFNLAEHCRILAVAQVEYPARDAG